MAGGRTLILNSARHSYVDLNDPEHLEFAYVQWIGAVTDTVRLPRAPISALHLGGGGFTVPTYVEATRPGSDQLVLELDGGLVDLDKRELGLRTGPNLRTRIGDARVGLAEQAGGAYDLVVGDAFGHLVVPWHLATREMAADIARVLKADGVYAQNVIDYPPGRFIRAELATVADVFPHVALIAPAAALAGADRLQLRHRGLQVAPAAGCPARRPGTGGSAGHAAQRAGAGDVRRGRPGADRRLRAGRPATPGRLGDRGELFHLLGVAGHDQDAARRHDRLRPRVGEVLARQLDPTTVTPHLLRSPMSARVVPTASFGARTLAIAKPSSNSM